VLEPARLRQAEWASVLPAAVDRTVVVTHTRPHIMHGLLGPLQESGSLRVLGYRNAGGTLDTPGMLFVNGASWAHVLLAAGQAECLSAEEQAALRGECSPQGIICPLP
jgi:phosphoketolase